ncbi:hypothetical protein [Citrobacter freundii complex sp. 2022EL-00972]|uniref:hypothetical protein n=1 Tax=Citrobacter freundii complex sp. 2022EL-00972 TaxID=2994609 RepID=UPI0022472F75|nr:hypothetical protein [Citrobacter freundii complex sp. 2022EL-00972]MCX2460066.1 hypothetical protein [Citrobacter freundii complex sp. 2022EL-00972]
MNEKLLFRETENGKPVYQMRMLDNSPEAKQWVEVSEREFHSPLKDPSVWEKRVLYATSYAGPPAPDAAFLNEAQMCALSGFIPSDFSAGIVFPLLAGLSAQTAENHGADRVFPLCAGVIGQALYFA